LEGLGEKELGFSEKMLWMALRHCPLSQLHIFLLL
jgi:hypothetical protein